MMHFDKSDETASWLYSKPAFVKLGILCLISISLFWVRRLDIILVILACIIVFYPLSGIKLIRVWQLLYKLWWLFAILFIFQLFSVSWQASLIVVFRLAVLLLLANLVTLTTSVSKMMETFEQFFCLLKPVGVKPKKAALALSLTLRFIPVLISIADEVREVQQARGLENNILARIAPVIIRSLKMVDDVSSAIEARGYDGE